MNVRSLRELRLGKPAFAKEVPQTGAAKRAKAAAPKGEGGLLTAMGAVLKYVYILEIIEGAHFYVGLTDDLRARLANHNSGQVPHTSKFKPWQIKTYVAFSDERRAAQFEKYLKSPSGRAFAKKRL